MSATQHEDVVILLLQIPARVTLGYRILTLRVSTQPRERIIAIDKIFKTANKTVPRLQYIATQKVQPPKAYHDAGLGQGPATWNRNSAATATSNVHRSSVAYHHDSSSRRRSFDRDRRAVKQHLTRARVPGLPLAPGGWRKATLPELQCGLEQVSHLFPTSPLPYVSTSAYQTCGHSPAVCICTSFCTKQYFDP